MSIKSRIFNYFYEDSIICYWCIIVALISFWLLWRYIFKFYAMLKTKTKLNSWNTYLTWVLTAKDSIILTVYSFCSKTGMLSLMSWTSTKMVRFVSRGGTPISLAVITKVCLWAVSKSRCLVKVTCPVFKSTANRGPFFPEECLSLDCGWLPAMRYWILPLEPLSRSFAWATYKGTPRSTFSGTEIRTVFDSNSGELSLTSMISMLTWVWPYDGGSPLVAWTFSKTEDLVSWSKYDAVRMIPDDESILKKPFGSPE